MTTSRWPFYRNTYLLVALLGATAACSPLPKPQLQLLQAAPCAQAPLEEALAYDPGSNWFNVATACPSTPSQLTQCIQSQLDALKDPKTSPVLYFPNGHYTIDATLRITGINGAILLGEDPAKTVITWGGPPAEGDPPLANAPRCQQGLSFGQDPACDVGNMIHIDGSLNVKITRLTFDGQIPNSPATAKAIVRVSFYQEYSKIDGQTRYASTANEFSDLVLRHAWYGIRAGFYGGSNDAENFMRRVTFQDLSRAGFSAESQNSMNNNVWDSSFSFCGVGVQADFGAFNVYNSTFFQSQRADLVSNSGFDFVIQGNTSIGSPTFYRGQGAPRVLIQGNKITGPGPTAIEVLPTTSVLILDNVIQTPPLLVPTNSSYLPVVVWQSYYDQYPQPSNHVITGNVFSAPQASAVCAFQGGGPNFGNLADCWSNYLEDPLNATPAGGYFFGNTFNTSVAVDAPAPVPTPVAKPLLPNARIFPCNGKQGCSDADNINNALQLLSSFCSQRPILHLTAGIYSIQKTVLLPNHPKGQPATGCPIQIFGDSASPNNGTILSWDVPSGQPHSEDYMFELPSPAQAVLQDLLIVNKAYFTHELLDSAGRGILVHSTDDPTAGGVVYLNQVNIRSADSEQRPLPVNPQPGDNVGFLSAGFDHLKIEAEQSGFVGGDTAIRVIGGGAGASAAGMDGTRAVRFRGVPLSLIYQSQFDVQNYGNLYVAGLDAEGYTHGIRLDAPQASGRLTVTTGHIAGSLNKVTWKATPADAGKILVGSFAGEVNLLGLAMNLPVRVTAAADAAANVLGFGLYYRNDWYWYQASQSGWWVTNPEDGSWNSDGPPTPNGSPCADPKRGGIDQSNTDFLHCMTVYPHLRPQPLASAPTYVDCASYAAWNTLPGSPISYANVLPHTQHYQPTGQGVFYVEGATPAGHTWFLNDLMWDYDWNDKDPQGYFHVTTRCRDILPPQAPPQAVPVIAAALKEIRKDTTAVPHPCQKGVTDVRLFRLNIAPLASRTGIAVMQ